MEIPGWWLQHRAMRRAIITLFFLAALVQMAMAFAQTRVEVALYDYANLGGEIREGMKAETSKIFLQAGVELGWIDCFAAKKSLNPAQCQGLLGQDYLMLQLVPGRGAGAPESFGMALIEGGSPVLARLYLQSARELAQAANWDFADLLGHAAAHEVGHLLLGLEHSGAGVMRAKWRPEQLRSLFHNWLVFLPGQLGDFRASFKHSSHSLPLKDSQ